MESTRESLDSMPAALEVALNYIVLHDLIKERHTLLSMRLVSSAWRKNDSLNSRITSIKLRTPEDVLVLERFLGLQKPTTPGVWQDISDAVAFRSVRKLVFSKSLRLEEVEVPPSLSSEQTLKGIELTLRFKNLKDFLACSLALFAPLYEHRPVWPLLDFVSSLSIGTLRKDGLREKFDFDGLHAVAYCKHLTHLAVLGLEVYETGTPWFLLCIKGVESLRHLELRLHFNDLQQLGMALEMCGMLTQLSKLDLELEIHDPEHAEMAFFTVKNLEDLLREKAPTCLQKCGIYITTLSCILQHAVFKESKLQACGFMLYLRIHDLEGSAQQINREARRLIQDHEAEAQVQAASKLMLTLRLPPDCFLTQLEIDVSLFKGIEDISVWLSRSFNHGERYNEAWGVLGPTFINPSGATLVAKKFSLFYNAVNDFEHGYSECDTPGTDVSAALKVIPTLMPNLEDFRTNAIRASPECISELRALTNLKDLSLQSNKWCGPVLDLSLLPPCIRDLHISARTFESMPTPPLPHLTKCYVLGLHEPEPGLSPFRHCGAPLTELIFWGRVRADFVAATFRTLEELLLVMEEGDVSPLGSLPVLRKLELVKKPQVHDIIGLPRLTQIMQLKLRIQREASRWMEVSQLTQLRKLSVSMEERVLLENVDYFSETHRQISHALEQVNEAQQLYLSAKMPHTVVEIS